MHKNGDKVCGGDSDDGPLFLQFILEWTIIPHYQKLRKNVHWEMERQPIQSCDFLALVKITHVSGPVVTSHG
jgi:hypothetical protein